MNAPVIVAVKGSAGTGHGLTVATAEISGSMIEIQFAQTASAAFAVESIESVSLDPGSNAPLASLESVRIGDV